MKNNTEEIISQVYTQNIDDATRWSVLSLAAVTILYLYLSFDLYAWQLWTAASITCLGTIIASLNFLHSLNWSPRTRINLLLLSTEIIVIFITFLLEGLGWILALTIVLVSTVILTTTMRKPDWKLVSRSLLFACLTLLLDYYGPHFRLPAQELFLWGYLYAILVIVFGVALFYNIGWNLKNQSLRTRLITTFGFVAMMIILGVTFFLNRSESNSLHRGANAQFKQQAQSSALIVDIYLQNVLDELARIANQTDSSLPQSDLNSSLEPFKTFNPIYNDLWLIDTDGTIIAQTAPFDETAVFPIGVPWISNPSYVDGQYQILVAIPVMNNGKTAVTATLVANTNLHTFLTLLSQNLSYAAKIVTSSETISLMAPDLPIPHPPLSQEEISQLLAVDAFPETISNPEADDVVQSLAVIGTETAVNNLNWYILLEQPATQISQNNSRQGNINTVIGMAGAVLFVLTSIYFSNQIVQPIHQLTDAATSVTAGNLNKQIDIKTNNEMGVLADAFNNMTRQLKDHVDELETRVNERTAALSFANTQLANSELRFRALTSLATDFVGVLIFNSGSLYIDWLSEETLKLFGISQNDSDIGPKLASLVHPEDISAGRSMFAEVLSGKKSNVEIRAKTATEQTIWLHVHAQSFANENFPNERLVFIAGRDITQQRQAQIALNQAEKLHSLGVLAGGIAHDFNNLLTGIMGQASLVKFHAEHNRPITKNLDSLLKAAERASELTKKLLAYAGKGQYELRVINLNAIVVDNHVFLQTLIPPNVEIALNLSPQPLHVKVDSGQIQQVIMNLILNAANACSSKGGFVTIKTASCTFSADNPPQTIAQTPLAEGAYQQLIIEDNGIGMSQETLTKIFEPFFTTRPHGRGLGLSATLGIIQSHHGGVQVKSNLGEGTTFTIFLPVAESPIALPTLPVETNRCLQGQVLVIDDEQVIRDIAADGLTMMGFQVMTAANGKEGLRKLNNNSDNLQLILVDMKMPIMNGAEFLAQLRQTDKSMKVIFSSGYSETEIDTYLKTDENLWFLQKPYTIDNLQKLVNDVIGPNQNLA